MNLIIDSSALIALLRNEAGAETVQNLIDDPANTSHVHAVNLCEVYYDFRRMGGEEIADRAVKAVCGMRVSVREDMDAGFWRVAGRYKSDVRRISLADCFCASLAERISGEIVTADREFEPVEKNGPLHVRMIR